MFCKNKHKACKKPLAINVMVLMFVISLQFPWFLRCCEGMNVFSFSKGDPRNLNKHVCLLEGCPQWCSLRRSPFQRQLQSVYLVTMKHSCLQAQGRVLPELHKSWRSRNWLHVLLGQKTSWTTEYFCSPVVSTCCLPVFTAVCQER